MRTRDERKTGMELRRRERIITVPRNVVSDVRATFLSLRVATSGTLFGRPRRARLADAEQHRARERALRRRNGVEQSERQPARPANERKIVAEQPDEAMRERDAGHPIGAPAARIAAQHCIVADLFAGRVEDDLSELPRVAQPDVES